MPRVLKGDIFATARANNSELAVVFGSIEFNQMNMYWRQFTRTIASLSHIRNPFSELSQQPCEYANGRWLWFIGAHHDDGLSDSDIVKALEAAFSWAHQMGLKAIITNGIADTGDVCDVTVKQKNNDHRAQLLIGLTTDFERRFSLDITLVSLNNVFTRNVP